MPVPSNPQDLINLIREKLFNNTSGLIEEPDLREVLENIVKVLDAKFSLLSPNLTPEQFEKWDLLLDYMAKETKGVLSPTSPAPTEKGKYLLSSTGTYTNLGGLVATADKLNYAYFNGTNWSLVSTSFPEGQNSFTETDENNVATMKPTADFVKAKIAEKVSDNNNSENLHEFKDNTGKLIAFIDKFGNFNFYVSEEKKEELNRVKLTSDENFLLKLISSNDKMFFAIDKYGKVFGDIPEPFIPEQTDFTNFPVNSANVGFDIVTLNERVSIPSTAKGRNSTATSNDAPTISLTDSGYTHPSMIHIPSKWNGFEFWMAITPTFGIIASQPRPSDFENPHIFCGNWNSEKTEIIWQEPVGITNPIDVPPPADLSLGYWSDTHLMLGDDGYLYCFYRGSAIPSNYLNTSAGNHTRAIVYKKSKDGVNWSNRTFVYSTTTSCNDKDIGLMSPAITQNGTIFHKYELVDGNVSGLILTGENQTQRVVVHTTSKDLVSGFSNINQDAVVNFKNRPWGTTKDVWHLDACKFGNTYFLLLNVAPIGQQTGEDLYLAYSGDGWNFKIIETPIFLSQRYRSSLTPFYENGKFGFMVLESLKTDGSLKLKKITLKNL